MVALVFLLVWVFFIFLTNEIAQVGSTGFPPKDKDVLEFLVKAKNSNPRIMDGSKKNSLIRFSDGLPFISNSVSSCLMGCYINDVGSIPRWYKSYGEIKKLYGELSVKSVDTKTKREKLGL